MRVWGLTGRIVYGLLLAYVVPAMPLLGAMPRRRCVVLRGFGKSFENGEQRRCDWRDLIGYLIHKG